jgi:hypothetical protein
VADPGVISLGDSVTLELSAYGNVWTANIDGNPVSVPYGSITMTPTDAGGYTYEGRVDGPGGTGFCSASFEVDDDNR